MRRKDHAPAKMNIRCPRCRASFAVKSAPRRVVAYRCVCCGADFEVIPALSFLFGKTLSDAADGSPKLECPHCGQHYTMKSLPENAVVQCSRCLRGFAVPPRTSAKLERPAAAKTDDRRCG